MNKAIKRILLCFLVLVILLSGVPSFSLNASAASELPLRDRMIYTKLFQGKSRSVKQNYPVRVTLSVAGSGPVTFSGHAGVDVNLSQPEIVKCLKEAANVGKYNDIEQVLDDYDLVKRLKYELDFTKEDYEQFKNDMKTLFGIKGVGDILQDCLTISPTLFNGLNSDNPVDQAQAVDGIVRTGFGMYDVIKNGGGSFFKKPSLIPSVNDIVVNGAKLTAEQYKRDKKKWDNRVEYYNTRRELEQYYSNAQNVIRSKMSEKAIWTVSVNDYAQQDVQYDTMLTCPTTYVLQLNLNKTDDSLSFYGNYVGDIRLQVIADTKDADAQYAQNWCDAINGNELPELTSTLNSVSHSGDRKSFRVISDDYSTSEFEADFGSDSFSLRVSGGEGLFTAPIDMNALELRDYKREINHSVHLEMPLDESRVDYYITDLVTKNYRSVHTDWYIIPAPVTGMSEGHIADDDENGDDPRPYMKMTIEIFAGGQKK